MPPPGTRRGPTIRFPFLLSPQLHLPSTFFYYLPASAFRASFFRKSQTGFPLFATASADVLARFGKNGAREREREGSREPANARAENVQLPLSFVLCPLFSFVVAIEKNLVLRLAWIFPRLFHRPVLTRIEQELCDDRANAICS